MSFNSRQLRFLDLEFQRNPFPSQKNLRNLALFLNKPQVLFQNWFAQRNGKQPTGTFNVSERPSSASRFIPPPKDVNTVERTFHKCEIEFLHKEFAKNRHPGSLEFISISQELRVPVKKVKQWFQLQRRKSSNPVSVASAGPLELSVCCNGKPTLRPHLASAPVPRDLRMAFRFAAGPPPLVPIHQTSVKQFTSNSNDIQQRCVVSQQQFPWAMDCLQYSGSNWNV